MGKKTIIGFVVAIFLMGGVSGFFLGVRVQHEKVSKQKKEIHPADEEMVKPPNSREEQIMGWLVEFLDLDSVQKVEIRPLIDLALKEFRQLEQEHDSRIDGVIENSDLRISKFLTESQTQKLLKHNRDTRERRDARRARDESGEERKATQ
ncbi:hypothetical protein N8766_01895 [bacterium]|jgi:hypothetical protein|nr:hypothetical protein [Verrucomicrobiota bacterium]MDA7632838.1 hypothetical protein [bacterium]MDB4796769.1 hypothetical protein [bacterium]